jgi:hypothetical protein
LAFLANGTWWTPQLSPLSEPNQALQLWPSLIQAGKSVLLQGNAPTGKLLDLEIWNAEGRLLHRQSGLMPFLIPGAATQERGVCFYRLVDPVSGWVVSGRLLVE